MFLVPRNQIGGTYYSYLVSYYSCNDTNFNSIENCKECYEKDSCYLCKDNYTFINGNKSKCYEINELGEKYIIDPNDKSNYIKCSDFINNCFICNNSICLNCDEGYIFINDDFNNCLLKSSLNLTYYYSNDEKTYYSCENEKYKSNSECLEIMPKTTLINSEKIIANSTTYLTNPKTFVINSTNPITLKTITTKLITVSTTDITNLNSLINNSTILINNSATLKDNSIKLISNSITLITNPKSILTNSSTVIANSKALISNSITLITNPKSILTNSSTILANPKTLINNSITLITNTKSILISSTIIITHPKSLVTNSTALLTNQKSTVTNSITIITNPKTLKTYLTTVVTSPQTFKNNPTTIITDLKSIVTNSSTLTTKQKTIITNPITIITNSTSLISNLKTFISNPTTFSYNSTMVNNLKTSTTNTRTFITNLKTEITNPKTIVTYPKTYIINSTLLKTSLTTILTSQKSLTTIIKTTLINPKTIITTSIKTTEIKFNCIDEFPFDKITIILLQIKLKDHKLYLYLLIDSCIQNNFSLTIKINMYIQKLLRNLQQETKKEMVINISPLNYTKSNSYGGLYTFTPDNSFKEYLLSEGEKARIVVSNIISNKNKNEYSLEMGNNSDYLDTAKMEEKLQNNQAVDLGLIKNVNIYHVKSISQGCTFKLFTYETIKVSDREINLECHPIYSLEDKSIKCYIYKNKGRIECNLDENINSNCTLKNYLEFNNDELFSIILNEQNIIPITCSSKNNTTNKIKSGSSSKLSKALIILIILASIILVIIVVSFTFIFRKYKSNNEIINSNISKIDNSNDTAADILG